MAVSAEPLLLTNSLSRENNRTNFCCLRRRSSLFIYWLCSYSFLAFSIAEFGTLICPTRAFFTSGKQLPSGSYVLISAIYYETRG